MASSLKTVAYIVEDRDCPQFRYRVQNLVETLKSSPAWHLEVFLKSDLPQLDLSKISFVVIERQTAKDSVLLDFIDRVHRARKPVFFDLDDLVFRYRDINLILSTTHDKNYLYWLGYLFCLRRLARRVDGFLTTNSFLAEKLKHSFDKPVAVIPNSLNQAQIKTSEKALKTQKPHVGFRLGYFSGSPTHTKDFWLIEPELIRFLESHADAELKIVGYMDFSKSAQPFLDSGRISFEPPVDYLKLQEKIAEVDVNLAPLVENDFTNCKSELKFFEAAIAETTTIASPTFAFKTSIKDGETGFLARPGEWFKKLEYLYNHPEENRNIARAAKAYCLKEYYGKNLLKTIETAYEKLSQI